MNKQILKNKLIQILKLDDDEITQYIFNELKEINCKYYEDKFGNIFITKGNASLKPCLTAHIDSLRHDEDIEIMSNDKWIFGIDNKTGEQSCIGADDRNGIVIALAMLKLHDNLKIIFCQDEEMGCVGSGEIKPNQLKGISYIIGLDRKSSKGKEIITYTNGMEIASKGFKNTLKPLIKKYQYDLSNKGVFSDIGVLCCTGQVSGINVSVGYYREHTQHEAININDFLTAYDMVNLLIKEIPTKHYYNKIETPNYFVYKGKKSFLDYNFTDTYKSTHKIYNYCMSCGKLADLKKTFYGEICDDCSAIYSFMK